MLVSTPNAYFTQLFAILHEIPNPPFSSLSRLILLSHNDFLGTNWLFKARTDAAFFEKSCPKIHFYVWKGPFWTLNWVIPQNSLFLTPLEKSKRLVVHAGQVEHALKVMHAVRVTHAQSGSRISPLSAHPARTSPPFWPRANPSSDYWEGGNFGLDPSKTHFSTAY